MLFPLSWEKRRQSERVIHNENVVTIYTRIYSIQQHAPGPIRRVAPHVARTSRLVL